MKRKTREEKAITLIALIITIVVLLILAVVAINAVTGDGIIQHATNAKTEYEKAQDEEQDILSYYGEYLENKGDVGPWKQKGDEIIKENKDGSTTKLKIGDIVRYNPTKADDGSAVSASYTSLQSKNGVADQEYNVTEYTDWKVMGVDNGRILLLSALPDDTFNKLEIKISNGYIYGVDELNNISSIYGKGKGALKTRSIQHKDIERLLGYSREYIVSKSYVSDIDLIKYGEEITYTMDENNVISYRTKDKEGQLNLTTMHYVENNEWKQLQAGDTKKFISNYYSYDIAYNYEIDRYDVISTTQEKYNILYGENSNASTQSWWIADSVITPLIIKAKNNDVCICYALMNSGMYTDENNILVGNIGAGVLVYGNHATSESMEIRVVVELENDVNLSYDETNREWKIN